MVGKHIHHDALIGYAEGKKIQWRLDDSDIWQDIKQPSFNPKYKYRIKPERKKFRVWEDIYGYIYAVTEYSTIHNPEDVSSFKRWITDWTTYDD